MIRLSRKLPKLAMLLLLTLALENCSTTTGIGAIDGGCRAFKPIRWSKTDTPDTVLEVKAHNAAWLANCKGK